MIQIIAGEKGKGKTKILIEKANNAVKEAKGSIVYLDKNNKHMYELSNKIRLINVKSYCIDNCSEFLGFICGLISQDHDLEHIFLDSFLKLANIENSDLLPTLEKLEHISNEFNIDFILSLSRDEVDLPEPAKKFVSVSL
ncbi:hypothetical protein GCM10023142_05830 [Anaerocolumna aminovalerica]|jgi:transcriptional regulator with XRE-family HTH domain|uniref:Twitching motility protein PilT n=1 Tax=Anaerocolumna aminovalerica TaxID=1527 RepID=A0A1I5CIT6_9FIRM|nr:twitching motility protein PilT [Anaerocolumna aminovalerica]MBU5332598.1 twitching motility protein PilT [Anaerocolumna aminovalerica]MDU6265004.1 twitching motility protein PilT [Anaerocolumna aminovalerica]SFN86772.1 hypothetical protein SAMN04489757_10385 [Anaerocolumna aminovalerica]